MDLAAFRAAGGVEDWRLLGSGLHARYRCSSLAEATRFAAAVVDGLSGTDRAPDLDLRATSVTVRIPEHEDAFLEATDLPLARRIQEVARGQGLEPDPASLRSIQIAVAHAEGVEVDGFWRAVLGYVPVGDEDARDPENRGPRLWFHPIEGDRPGRGRTHIDVYVPEEQAEGIVAAAVAAGGRVADDSHAPAWWTLASPDNHGVDIAPWPDRG